MTGASDRLLAIAGSRNMRDLGGYAATDGRRVRRGLLLRGGHPAGLTDEGAMQFARLGLGAIIDLRTTEERAGQPYPAGLTDGIDYWTRDYDLSRGDLVAMLRDPATGPDDMRARMLQSYRMIVDEQRPGIGAMFALLRGGRTLLINCTAGKDRTGAACAILLTALGVPHDVVREDYVLTERVQDPRQQLFHVDPDGPFAYLLEIDPEVWRVMMRSAPEYIDAAFAALVENHGSIEAYLAAVHGLDAAALADLRDRLLEG
jgi:protein-tyrosine phosphatase